MVSLGIKVTNDVCLRVVIFIWGLGLLVGVG